MSHISLPSSNPSLDPHLRLVMAHPPTPPLPHPGLSICPSDLTPHPIAPPGPPLTFSSSAAPPTLRPTPPVSSPLFLLHILRRHPLSCSFPSQRFAPHAPSLLPHPIPPPSAPPPYSASTTRQLPSPHPPHTLTS
ncbi:hypothetical protein CesoFtcFv8_013417 [Champsocephalus esox]|uniref:Uncharacterized protein n=1 Tax=Champsocephalus esox TaxID=159716 RepID=A0AAN8GTP3_9TELE|nr:hypothetical protein CesoFtcFv8_013417 [Champsocephalus esox]